MADEERPSQIPVPGRKIAKLKKRTNPVQPGAVFDLPGARPAPRAPSPPSPSDESKSNVMEAQALLNRSEREARERDANYHDLLVERDGIIEEKRVEISALSNRLADLEEQMVIKENSLSQCESELGEMYKTQRFKEKEYNDLASKEEVARNRYIKAQEDAAMEKNWRHDVQDELKEMQKKFAELEATNKALHREIDASREREAELVEAAEEHEEMKETLAQLDEEFEDIFKDLGKGEEMTYQGYMDHIRELETHRLHHEPSQDSLDRLAAKNSRGLSLSEQLGTNGYQSSEDGDREEGVDFDDTLTAHDVFANTTSTSSTAAPLQLSGISAVETIPSTPEVKDDKARDITNKKATEPAPLDYSGITSVNTTPIMPEIPSRISKQRANGKPPAPPSLHYSGITSVDTSPITPDGQVTKQYKVPTQFKAPTRGRNTTIFLTHPPQNAKEFWNVLPLWMKIAAIIALIVYIFMLFSVISERNMWLSANDLTRQHVVRLGMGSESSWLAPYLYMIEDWLEIDRALLG